MVNCSQKLYGKYRFRSAYLTTALEYQLQAIFILTTDLLNSTETTKTAKTMTKQTMKTRKTRKTKKK